MRHYWSVLVRIWLPLSWTSVRISRAGQLKSRCVEFVKKLTLCFYFVVTEVASFSGPQQHNDGSRPTCSGEGILLSRTASKTINLPRINGTQCAFSADCGRGSEGAARSLNRMSVSAKLSQTCLWLACVAGICSRTFMANTAFRGGHMQQISKCVLLFEVLLKLSFVAQCQGTVFDSHLELICLKMICLAEIEPCLSNRQMFDAISFTESYGPTREYMPASLWTWLGATLRSGIAAPLVVNPPQSRTLTGVSAYFVNSSSSPDLVNVSNGATLQFKEQLRTTSFNGFMAKDYFQLNFANGNASLELKQGIDREVWWASIDSWAWFHVCVLFSAVHGTDVGNIQGHSDATSVHLWVRYGLHSDE